MPSENAIENPAAGGCLYVVGLGPGGAAAMTAEARAVLDAADVIAGYTVYVDLLRPDYPGKRFYTTGMRQEVERCRWALSAARDEGYRVALVCSGDAGVYGMAGPVLELAPEYPGVEVAVIPGITAACAGAAVLGAPLMNDFCCVSLSDLLTPWEVVERRLVAAAAGDFALVLYNPMSRTRPDHLRRACAVLRAHGKGPATVCGWVRNIGRPGQEARVLTLAELQEAELDMFTTAFVGTAATRAVAGRMVTPRGYGIATAQGEAR